MKHSIQRKRRSDQIRCRRCFMILHRHPHGPDDPCPITPSQKTALALFIRVEGRFWLRNLLAERGTYKLAEDLHRLVNQLDTEGIKKLGRSVRF